MRTFSKNPANPLIMLVMILTMAFILSCSDDKEEGNDIEECVGGSLSCWKAVAACDEVEIDGHTGNLCWEVKKNDNSVKNKCDEDGGTLKDKCPDGAGNYYECGVGVKRVYAYGGEGSLITAPAFVICSL
jgi:hypothetical protein